MNNRQEPYRGSTQYRRAPQYDRHRDYEHEREVNRGDYEMQDNANWRNSEDYNRREFDDLGGFRNSRFESDQRFNGDYRGTMLVLAPMIDLNAQKTRIVIKPVGLMPAPTVATCSMDLAKMIMTSGATANAIETLE